MGIGVREADPDRARRQGQAHLTGGGRRRRQDRLPVPCNPSHAASPGDHRERAVSGSGATISHGRMHTDRIVTGQRHEAIRPGNRRTAEVGCPGRQTCAPSGTTTSRLSDGDGARSADASRRTRHPRSARSSGREVRRSALRSHPGAETRTVRCLPRSSGSRFEGGGPTPWG